MNTIAVKILRYSFAFLFLWFGSMQLMHPLDWIGFLPVWTGQLPLAPATLIILNGCFEIMAGILLAIGLFSRWVALLLCLHLAYIAYAVGDAIGMRDIFLAMTGSALVFCRAEPGTVDYWLKK